jgi:hypothetical protein
MVVGNRKENANGLKILLVLLFLVLSLGLLSCVNQEYKFIGKKQLIYLDDESKYLYYSLYKVGIDNYNYDLFVSDSIYIGSLYLNDASYKNVEFNVTKTETIVTINCNYGLAAKVKKFHYGEYTIIIED